MTARQAIAIAMNRPDLVVLHCLYVSDRSVSIRVVSPYRWQPGNRFIGFCFTCEAERSFIVDRIHRFCLVKANLVSAPVPAREIEYDKNR